MKSIFLSQKLIDYIKIVEDKTGRKVVIHLVNALSTSGMEGSFVPNPDNILIELSEGIKRETIEHTVSHEVTHGWVSYGLGYPNLTPVENVDPIQLQKLSLVTTMVEDIVVNHILYDHGFSPYPEIYLETVSKEIKAASKGVDFYSDFEDQDFKNKFKIFRYVAAWGLLKYFALNDEARRTLSRFVKVFKYSFRNQYPDAIEITKLIEENDIFTAEGYTEVLNSCLKLWGLDNVVKFDYGSTKTSTI